MPTEAAQVPRAEGPIAKAAPDDVAATDPTEHRPTAFQVAQRHRRAHLEQAPEVDRLPERGPPDVRIERLGPDPHLRAPRRMLDVGDRGPERLAGQFAAALRAPVGDDAQHVLPDARRRQPRDVEPDDDPELGSIAFQNQVSVQRWSLLSLGVCSVASSNHVSSCERVPRDAPRAAHASMQAQSSSC